jgi:phosphopantetheine adenylyltransferase
MPPVTQSSSPSALLLLPPIPHPPTYPAIKAAYHASLTLTLRQLVDANPSSRITLDIALPCPHLYETSASRSALYATTQTALANVYKLVCIIAARQGIEVADVEGDGVVDVRVLLLAYPRDGVLKSREGVIKSGQSDDGDGWIGPVIGLRTLASCGRSWGMVFSVETEQGEELLKSFKKLGETTAPFVKVRGGIVQVDTSAKAEQGESHICDSVAVGGTFDHLHIGHKLLLTMVAFALDPPVFTETVGEEPKEKVITIGMTAADLLAKKKYAELLQSWKTRTDRTHLFMKGIMLFGAKGQDSESIEEVHNPGANGHAVLIRLSCPRGKVVLRYTEIWDPFGPTITDPDIDTLIVSGETRSGGQMVNDKRGEMKMKTLQVFEVDVLDAEEEDDGSVKESKALESSFQAKLSSSEIRKAQAEKIRSRSRV